MRNREREREREREFWATGDNYEIGDLVES